MANATRQRAAAQTTNGQAAIANELGLLRFAGGPDQLTINEIHALRRDIMGRFLDRPNGRDINKECGYPETLDPHILKGIYDREGIGYRVVALYPEESWAADPEIYDDDDDSVHTEFEKAWMDLVEDHNLYEVISRLDELAGIGRFGVLLLGYDDGKEFMEPVKGIGPDGMPQGKPGEAKAKLNYLRVFDETLVTVVSYEQDVHNPRFGLPLEYQLTLHDPMIPLLGSGQGPTPTSLQNVHWTRIIHFADLARSSEVFGTPRQQACFNRIYDLRKILSGSGEMFWQGAFPGLAFETDPRVFAQQGVEIDKESLQAEFRRYSDGLQRYVATLGLSVKSLSPQVSSPDDHIMGQIQAICIALACPMRVFMGSERGELASGQDAKAWHGRLHRRRAKVIRPKIIKPLITRLVYTGVLPPTAVMSDDGRPRFEVYWPDLNTPDDETKANIALKRTQAIAQYTAGGCEVVMEPYDFLVKVLDIKPDEARSITDKAEELAEELEAKAADDALAAEESEIRITKAAATAKAAGSPQQETGQARRAASGKPVSKRPAR